MAFQSFSRSSGRTVGGKTGPQGPIGPQGPRGLPALGTEPQQETIANWVDEADGPNPVAQALNTKIAALAALVTDLSGNPLGTGHVAIRVDTANGNSIDDIVWVED